MNPPQSAPVRAPADIPLGVKLSLRRNARRDGARNVPHIEPLNDAGTIDAHSPQIGVLAAEAEDSARAEWRELRDRTRGARQRHDDAVDLLADIVTAIVALHEQGVDANGSTPESEELRRLAREREQLSRRIASEAATIDERIKASMLAIRHIYDRANLHAMHYWQALRRHHRHRSALAAEPMTLVVPSWVDPNEIAASSRRYDQSAPVNLNERKRRASS